MTEFEKKKGKLKYYNYVIRVLTIQEITIYFTKKGVTKVWIFKNIIYPRFLISLSTYNNYLSVNARSELRKKGYNWEEINIITNNQLTDEGVKEIKKS